MTVIPILLASLLLAFAADDDDYSRMTPNVAEKLVIERCLDDKPFPERACIDVMARPCRETQQGSSTTGTTACFAREAAIWDEKLNAWYGRALTTQDPEERARIRDTQRLWIQFRDRACADLAGRGGSMVPLTRWRCLRDQTAYRAFDLAELAWWAERQ